MSHPRNTQTFLGIPWTSRQPQIPCSRVEYARYRMDKPEFVPNHVRWVRAMRWLFLACVVSVAMWWALLSFLFHFVIPHLAKMGGR